MDRNGRLVRSCKSVTLLTLPMCKDPLDVEATFSFEWFVPTKAPVVVGDIFEVKAGVPFLLIMSTVTDVPVTIDETLLTVTKEDVYLDDVPPPPPSAGLSQPRVSRVRSVLTVTPTRPGWIEVHNNNIAYPGTTVMSFVPESETDVWVGEVFASRFLYEAFEVYHPTLEEPESEREEVEKEEEGEAETVAEAKEVEETEEPKGERAKERRKKKRDLGAKVDLAERELTPEERDIFVVASLLQNEGVNIRFSEVDSLSSEETSDDRYDDEDDNDEDGSEDGGGEEDGEGGESEGWEGLRFGEERQLFDPEAFLENINPSASIDDQSSCFHTGPQIELLPRAPRVVLPRTNIAPRGTRAAEPGSTGVIVTVSDEATDAMITIPIKAPANMPQASGGQKFGTQGRGRKGSRRSSGEKSEEDTVQRRSLSEDKLKDKGEEDKEVKGGAEEDTKKGKKRKLNIPTRERASRPKKEDQVRIFGGRKKVKKPEVEEAEDYFSFPPVPAAAKTEYQRFFGDLAQRADKGQTIHIMGKLYAPEEKKNNADWQLKIKNLIEAKIKHRMRTKRTDWLQNFRLYVIPDEFPCWGYSEELVISFVDSEFLVDKARFNHSDYVQDLQQARWRPWLDIKTSNTSKVTLNPLAPESVPLLDLSAVQLSEKFVRIIGLGQTYWAKTPTSQLVVVEPKTFSPDGRNALKAAFENATGDPLDNTFYQIFEGVYLAEMKASRFTDVNDATEKLHRSVPIFFRTCMATSHEKYRHCSDLEIEEDVPNIMRCWRSSPMDRQFVYAEQFSTEKPRPGDVEATESAEQGLLYSVYPRIILNLP